MDLLTVLATAAEEHAHSTTPFLVAGGVLAVFAIIVGAVGVVRPTWGGAAMNAVMGVGTVLAAGTMVAIVAVS
jgi:hypothetical protein